MARKPTREKFKTYKNVFDEATNRVLFKLESQNYFDELVTPISIGKEANVFIAMKGNEKIAVKIYRVNVCDFKKMFYYMEGDLRFSGLKKQRRKVVFAWAKREFRNLLVARKAGIKVPKPHVVRDNVLVMDFIGDKDAAPQLIHNLPKQLNIFFDLLLIEMKKFYKIGLVHGDLSAYNILNYNDLPCIIDLSHGIKSIHPNYNELWKRDVNNVGNFFKRHGLKISNVNILKEIKNGI